MPTRGVVEERSRAKFKLTLLSSFREIPTNMDDHIELALGNITKYGDTDVFPFPLENHIFFDKHAETVDLLRSIHSDFDNCLKNTPPIHERSLAAVGYTGFRWATQIDPLWNAYLLTLVISVGREIENARIPIHRNVVFSYRFNPDSTEKTLFDRNIGWIAFQRTSGELAQKHSFVLVCDISDFYTRIYHHRLENALKKAVTNKDTVRRILLILFHIAKGVSYGLPIGGPAARLLSELLLNRIDRLLLTSGVTFCRFADDYHIFANSREQAYEYLVLLSEKLLDNEGLPLQKAKTRILSSEEFLTTSEFTEHHSPEDKDEAEARNFLSLRLHYDPYSPTADDDYELIKEELNKFDIVGMLAREMRKSRIHQALTKKLIRAVEYLAPVARNAVIVSLLENLSVLYPIFPSVMILIKSVMTDLDDQTRGKVFKTLRELIREGSYITRVPVNLAFTIRVLSHDNSDETDEVLNQVYNATTNTMIRRDVILAMAKRNSDYWISDLRKRFLSLTQWEKTAFIVASYILEDEGKHWRDGVKNGLAPLDKLAKTWAAEKKQSGYWDIPL